MLVALTLTVAFAAAPPRGQLVDVEPVWTGAAAGVGAAGGTLAGIGALVALAALSPPGAGTIGVLVDELGILLPVAGAAFGAFAGSALFLSLEDTWIVATAAGSGALSAGALVLLVASFGALLAARNGTAGPDDATLALAVAGGAATLAAAAIALPVGMILDEAAY